MKALQGRERKLLFFLGGAVLLGIHLVFLQLALRFDRGNRLELTALQAEVEEARMWLGEKDTWESRAAWLEENLRPWPAESPEGALLQYFTFSQFFSHFFLQVEGLSQSIS